MQSEQTREAEIRDLERGVAALGPNFDDDVLAATRALYEPHWPAPSAGIEVEQDIAYGTAARNRLDLYRPQGSKLPVVLYAHGGGFVTGNKRGAVNLGHDFARRGFLAVTMNYRLAPVDRWPAATLDIAAAVEWIVLNGAGRGADPSQIFLLAQSAGAAHAASYLFDPDFQPRASQTIRAAAFMSGVYQLEAPLRAGPLAYYGDDEATYARRAPQSHVGSSRVPLLLTVAQFDPARIATRTLELAAELTRSRGSCPRLAWLAGHNHVSTVLSLGTAQQDVGNLLAQFFRGKSAAGPAPAPIVRY